jgi:DNA-binding LytR/AlgR family response regulator
MKALIIEDESPAARRLQKMIRNVRNDVEILEVIDSVENGIKWLSENDKPDVIFSDIQLADGRSFEIYSQVQVTCPIIFTTAYDEYAIKAFELNSVGYLLKPFSEDDLSKAIAKVEEAPEDSNEIKINEILSQLGIEKKYKSRFLIHKGDSLIPISTEDIAYIYTHDKLVVLVNKENQHYYLNQRMDELEHQLDPKNFFRLNRQYISSFGAIEKVANHFNGKLRVYLKPTTEEVMISRIKAGAFKSWLDD